MDTLNDIISGLKWGQVQPIEAHDRIEALQKEEIKEILRDFSNYLLNVRNCCEIDDEVINEYLDD